MERMIEGMSTTNVNNKTKDSRQNPDGLKEL
jgi:hypothetical protein